MSGAILLAFTLWLLLSADFSWPNILLGGIGALVVSKLVTFRFSARQLLSLVWTGIRAIPQVLAQSFAIVFMRYSHEQVTQARLEHPHDPWARFSQIFLITYTPKTLVTRDDEDGQMELHCLERKADV